MKKFLINILCGFIPFSSLRKQFRAKLLNYKSETMDEASIEYRQNMLKQRIKRRWEIKDFFEKFKLCPRFKKCPICDYKDSYPAFKTHLSSCMFGGGNLKRYECPQCGLIYGPEKILNLSEKELAKEYEELYSYYTEGMTDDYQYAVFLSLNPSKEGIYLNYGCGQNITSIKKARENGYNLFGYEPYSNINSKESFIITDINKLQEMKFDGICSHNVIEHLTKPIEEFKLFNSMLKNNGVMAHSTECYKFSYEVSRFHVFYFIGKSLKILAKKTGFECSDTDNEMIKKFKTIK